MDAVVRLRHAVRSGDWRMYFYDGELPVVNSILTIPASRPEWIQRAWIMGFRMTADGRVIADLAKHIRAETADEQPVACDHEEVMVNDDEQVCCANCGEPMPDLTPADLDNDEEPDGTTEELPKVDAAPVDETENAVSDEESTEDDEGPDRGGQPAGEDGVRSSEPDRGEGDAGGGDAGSGGSEPAEG